QIEEEHGIEKFVQLCRESVKRYVADWERLTDRIGFWLDLDEAYWTMSPEFVETVWWILKQIWDKGLLEEDFKVVPYCPRCETALSSHEQHQVGAYKDVVDPAVYVRFPLRDDPSTALLIWTTTPWTLLSNTLAAVGPEVEYVKAEDPGAPGRFLILAEAKLDELLGDDARAIERMPGTALAGLAYVPPFDFVDVGDGGQRVRAAGFVTTSDGSGIVHLAPYGEEDMVMLKKHDLPVVGMIDAGGRVIARAGAPLAGEKVQEANPLIVENLRSRDLLFRVDEYQHAYPHCWRCQTPLLYFPRKDWYIRTSQIRDQLEASNEAVNWQPPTIKHGRFGDWLANNVDWSLSRDRYWGTPLPIWRCPNDHDTCVGSFEELSKRAGRDVSGVDPHRPYVDEIEINCPQCSSKGQRIKSVIDTWFDSGSMPFGQWHYPFENEAIFESRFPADFISEAIDQTRGWFYSLLAVATLVKGTSSYKNVVCLGHIVDTEGRKMSKSVGNVIDPWSVLDTQGADALRWYLLAGGTPWSARRLSIEIVEESLRKHLLTLWNTYYFWVTYASLEGFDPTTLDIPVDERPEMDRWILAELDDTVREVTEGLESFDATRGGKRLDRFVDDLSNWYVRRSRRRFWRSGEDADTRSAFLTLWECLTTVAQLTAPFTPFIADEIFTNLTSPDGASPESVHLSDWPTPRDDRSDDGLRSRMQLVRKIVGLGRSARTDAKVRTRQPLRRAVVVLPAAESDLVQGLKELIEEELNVKDVEVAKRIEELVTYSVKPNFKTLGPRFGARVKDVAKALAQLDAHVLVTTIEADGSATIDVGGEAAVFSADDLDIRIEGRSGFSLAREGAYGVALDLDLSNELKQEGIAREVVRAVQDLRKTSGLAVEDRISLTLVSDSKELSEALQQHRDSIASEVLATEIELDRQPTDGADVEALSLDGAHITIGLHKI
ncbi:MAG: isoleucine--tRNA ligase, partial [Actinomycetota bacterium]